MATSQTALPLTTRYPGGRRPISTAMLLGTIVAINWSAGIHGSAWSAPPTTTAAAGDNKSEAGEPAAGADSDQSESNPNTVVKLQPGELGTTRNVHTWGDCLLCGQPCPADLKLAQERGFRRVITLRSEGELDWDEAAAVRTLGMEFHQIGIRGATSFDEKTMNQLRKLLTGDAENVPTVLHCGSAYRVGAAWMVHRVLDDGLETEAAFREAQTIGLEPGAMERAARQLIQQVQAQVVASSSQPQSAADESLGTHGFAPSGDVPIHYVTKGQGPLVVMIHGFPDFWYTWRHQMPALAETFQVVAIDQRGYNQSGQPVGVDQYKMDKLVGDVKAVIQHFQRDKAIVVGHDWGGMVAWSFAMTHPEMTDRLVILNLPHPNGLLRELASNPQQRENSAYARHFQSPEAAAQLTAEGLATWVRDAEARPRYLEAFRRSSFEGMLNYYKANYPREPYALPTNPFPKIKCPVLMFHGLQDKALLAGALNDTWQWVEQDLSLVTVPKADHWVHHDAADLVTRTMVQWLNR